MSDADTETWDCVWWWKAKLPERKGTRCQVLARSAWRFDPRTGKQKNMNSVLVEFESDGHTVITSRYAVRKAKS